MLNEGGTYMKNKWLIGLFIATVIMTSGCAGDKKQDVPVDSGNDPIVIDSETIGVAEETPENDTTRTESAALAYDFDRSLESLFPLTEGYRWHFIGSVEYASVEVLNKIDRQHPDVTEIVIEGLVEDMSGLFLSDTSYLKQYSIFEHQLIRRFGPYESVVLKSPVNKSEAWENIYFDPVYGLFDARYIVREANNQMIVVEMTPISPEKDGVPKQFKMTTTYEVGKGVTLENRVYVYDNEGVEETFEFGYGLYEEGDAYDIPFVSRYFSKDPYISTMYHKGYFDYAIREATAYQFLYINRFRLTDALITEGYMAFITDLDKEDIRTVSIAENVLHIYAEKMDNPELLIGAFLDHYESVIENNQYILLDWFEEGTLNEIALYDIDTNQFSIPESLLLNDVELQAKLALMNDNGITFYFEKEQAVVKPSPKYLTNRLYYLSDIPMQSYLTLLKQAYEKMPYVRDGLSTLTLDELQTFILGFDSFKLGYSDSYIGESSIKWGERFFHQYLKPSSMIYMIADAPKAIHDDSLSHYKKTLQQLKDPQHAAVLSMVIELLEKHDNRYSTELGTFLLEYGVDIPSTYLQ